ncbi:MAG: hypothetical protein LC104_20350 [Bacteroidales bacterium]|nr:hypothetical protein [Bacteroidales bacterium]
MTKISASRCCSMTCGNRKVPENARNRAHFPERGAFTVHRQLDIVAPTDHPSDTEGWSVFVGIWPAKALRWGPQHEPDTTLRSAGRTVLAARRNGVGGVEAQQQPRNDSRANFCVAGLAALYGRDFGYMIWGAEDGMKKVVGTTFRPRQPKKGNEKMENGLMRSQHPQVSTLIHEWSH